jgi:hypothetical protein
MLLRYILDQGVPEHLTIVATSRPSDVSEAPELAAFRYQVACARSAHALRLSGLDADSVSEYAATLLGTKPTQSQINSLLTQTAGNAFLLKELVDEAGRLGGLSKLSKVPPSSISASLETRYGFLSQDSRTLLELAAVFGYPFSASFVAQVLGREEASIDSSLAEAISAGLIVQSDSPNAEFRFVHAIIRDAACARIPLSSRRSIHRILATHLKQQLASNDPRALLQFAYHFLSGGATDKQGQHVAILTSAAKTALQMFAYEDAARMYRRALDFLPHTPTCQSQQCQLLLSLGEAERLSGRCHEARQAFCEAANIARLSNNPIQFAHAALGLSGFRAINPVDVEAVSLLEEALDRIEPTNNALRNEIACARIVALHFASYLSDIRKESDGALLLAERLGDDRSLALALYAKLLTVVATSSAEELNELAGQTAKLALNSGEAGIHFSALVFKYDALVRLARFPESEQLLHQLGLATQQAPFARHRWQLALIEAGRRLAWDTPENIRTYIDQAAAIGAEIEPLTAGQHATAQSVVLEYLTGDLGNCRAVLFQIVQSHPDSTIARAAWGLSLCDIESLNDARDALAWFSPERVDSIPGAFAPLTLALLAEAAFLARDRPIAQLVFSRLRPWRNELITLGPGAGVIGATAFYLGLLTWFLGDSGQAKELLQRAAELELRVGARHAWRRSLAASAALDDGKQTFESLGTFRTRREAVCEVHPVLAPEATPSLANTFRKDVGVWKIAFNGRTSFVRDQLGPADRCHLPSGTSWSRTNRPSGTGPIPLPLV